MKNRVLYYVKRFSTHPWRPYFLYVVLGAIAFLAMVLGFVGFREYYRSIGQDLSDFDLLYLTLQLFVLQSGSLVADDGTIAPLNIPLGIARFIAPIVPAYAIIRTFTTLFSDTVNRVKIHFRSCHVMVIGSNRQARLYAEKFHQENKRVLVLPDQEDNTLVDFCRSVGLYLMKSGRLDDTIVEKIRKGKIDAIVSVGSDDDTNAKIALLLRKCSEEIEGGPISCQIHINDADAFNSLNTKENLDSESIRIRFLNINSAAAAHVREKYPPIPIRCKSTRDLTQSAELIPCMIMGTGPLVEPLVVDIIRQWKTRYENKGQKITIDLVGPGIERILTSAIQTLDGTPEYCTLHGIEQNDFDRLDPTDLNNLPDYSCIYFNYSDDITTILQAEKLSDVARSKDIRLIACVEERSELAELLWLRHNRAVSEEQTEAFIIYSIFDEICEPSTLPGGADEKVGAEIQRNYNSASTTLPGSADSATPYVDSNANQAKAKQIRHDITACGMIIEPLMSLRARDFSFTAEEKEKLAEMEHNRWMSERLSEGWVFGEKKSVENRINPNIVCWERLSPESKKYNLDDIDRYPEYLFLIDKQIRRPKIG